MSQNSSWKHSENSLQWLSDIVNLVASRLLRIYTCPSPLTSINAMIWFKGMEGLLISLSSMDGIWSLRMTLSTENSTSPKFTKSKNSNVSVSRSTDSTWDLGWTWIYTEEFEFLDLVDFGDVAFSVENVIFGGPLMRDLRILDMPFISLFSIHKIRRKYGSCRCFWWISLLNKIQSLRTFEVPWMRAFDGPLSYEWNTREIQSMEGSLISFPPVHTYF